MYGYVADGAIDTEQPAGSHVDLYDYVGSDALTFGTATTTPYVSSANVAGCEKCHGSPYMKHGYRVAEVDGLGDFAACKSCHYDTRAGGHQDWQILVDDPLRYVEIHEGDPLTTEEKTTYAYTATLMNDTHMSHAMEFPYPQRMSNCVTCHEGKLSTIFTDDNFNVATCKSCHPVTGDATYGTAERSLTTIWADAGVSGLHSADADCTACHKAGGAAQGVRMADLHNGGYEPMIYAANGVRYADAIVVTIEDAAFDSDTSVLTTDVLVTEAIAIDEVDVDDVVPDVRVALYPYESKDFYAYVSCTETDETGGDWSATCNLSSYAADMDSGKLRRVEVVVRPAARLVIGDPDEDDASDCGLGAGLGCDGHGSYCHLGECLPEDDTYAASTAPSRTFELEASDFADGYYPEIVDVEKCDACHDALATTFHSPDRSGNIVTCRMCHNPTSGGSHLEMQSRSLDSYIHAIHSFQPFDLGDVDFDDPVEALRAEMHTEHRFPMFTAKNCEACHNAGMYEVPDQTMTMPAVLSASDDVPDRDIKNVPSVVVGPAARACGACHRSHFINEDDFSGLVSFNQHTGQNGYRSDASWSSVLTSVMWWFGETELTGDPIVEPESCETCHADQGADHQAVYDDYIDPQ